MKTKNLTTLFTLVLPIRNADGMILGIADQLVLDNYEGTLPFVKAGYEVVSMPNLGIGVRNGGFVMHTIAGEIVPLTVNVDAGAIAATATQVTHAKRAGWPKGRARKSNKRAATSTTTSAAQ